MQSGKPPCPQSVTLSGSVLALFVPSAQACPPTLWAKTYQGNALSERQTPDGGFIIVGTTSQASVNGGSADAWVLRVDADGNPIWQKSFGTTKWDRAGSVDLTSDGGFIVSVWTQSFGAGSDDIWLLRFDGTGNIIWQKTYGGVSQEDPPSVHTVPGGGFILASSTNSFGVGDKDFWLIRLDSNGDIIWQRTYGSLGRDIVNSVQATSDNGFIVAGFTQDMSNNPNGDMSVLRVDSNGNVLWAENIRRFRG